MTRVFLLCLQSWDIFFRNTNAGAPQEHRLPEPTPPEPGLPVSCGQARPLVEAQPNVDKLVEDHLAVQSLIRGLPGKVAVGGFICDSTPLTQ